jgi:hypothetical protein
MLRSFFVCMFSQSNSSNGKVSRYLFLSGFLSFTSQFSEGFSFSGTDRLNVLGVQRGSDILFNVLLHMFSWYRRYPVT